jgi:hypothetical protein
VVNGPHAKDAVTYVSGADQLGDMADGRLNVGEAGPDAFRGLLLV